MPRDWISDEERARLDKEARWLRIDAWAIGLGHAIILISMLKAMFG